MPDQISRNPPDALGSLASVALERRTAMLPGLLAECRRVRRRRIATRAATGAAVCALVSGVVMLALFRDSQVPSDQLAAHPPDGPRQRVGGPATNSEATSTPIEIVQPSPDIIERLSIRTPSLVRVEYITTEDALALLQSNGDRYRIIEIAGRVEFQLIAKR